MESNIVNIIALVVLPLLVLIAGVGAWAIQEKRYHRYKQELDQFQEQRRRVEDRLKMRQS